jgi:nucleoside-diphosphate-sugar epimerase
MRRPTLTARRPIVVSGITGHVGRELSRQLLRVGFDVHGLTRQESANLSWQNDSITVHTIDGRTETLVQLFQSIRPEIVIHLAARATRNHLTCDVSPLVEANILFGTQILEAMRLCGCKRFVTAESILQYAESGKTQPVNLYAATKRAFAELLQYYVDAFDLAAFALVLPTLYSEYERNPKLMTDTAKALEEGTVLNLRTKDVRIDFVHVEDVANAFVTAALQLQGIPEHSMGAVTRYCISSGSEVTPLDLVALFERIGARRICVRTEESRGDSRRESPWRGPVLPGWSPAINLETGIKRMLSVRR